MELSFKIKINDKVYLRDPEESALGKKIVKHGLLLINKIGFEDFTFKKLAIEINTTEASIYRYFENKHRLLVYITTWYWSYLEHKVVFYTNNIQSAEVRLKQIIKLLVESSKQKTESDFITEQEAHKLVMWEGSKTYLSRHVTEDNKDRLFKPYKDLCNRISNIIQEYNPKYKYPHSLTTTIIEMSHAQRFFMNNLPALTDFVNDKDDKKLYSFIESLLFNSLK